MDILLDTVIDNLKLFPFLFITYLLLEYMETRTSDKVAAAVGRAGSKGPLIGALCGALPQCGFAVAASNFYAARVISLGTLVAVYLSTSDEMLPILISSAVSPLFIAEITVYKILCGIVFGYAVNFVWRRHHVKENINIGSLCEQEHCRCERGVWRSALHHSASITLFIFAVSLVLNYAMAYSDMQRLSKYMGIPLVGETLSALLGLIPNCSSSVILTQLYLDHYISTGALLSGSLVGSGAGILVLLRVNRHTKENALILLILLSCGIAGGLLSCLFTFAA